MDYKIILILLLIGHFIGDYYAQSTVMAQQKDTRMGILLKHGLYYLIAIIITTGLPLLVLAGAGASPLGWLILAIVPLTHFLIDLTKYRWPVWAQLFKKDSKAVFVTDQLSHILIIVIVALLYATVSPIAYSSTAISLANWYAGLNINLTAYDALRALCLALFLWKPASIVIQLILANKVNPTEPPETQEPQAEEEKEQIAGRYIGVAERYITVILVILQQYAALGLIIAAKSLARFNKIAKEQGFAERYLLGTLSSLLFAILGGLLFLYVF